MDMERHVSAVGAFEADGADWGYEGPTGPENWALLSEKYRTCGEGRRQSPIDIAGYEPGPKVSMSFSYTRDAKMVRNDGNQVHVEYEKGATLTIGRRVLQLESAHFHAPSEHRIEGRGYAAELHLVHMDFDGALVVVSQLFELGEASPEARVVMDAAPPVGGATVEGFRLNAGVFAPSDTRHFRYEGSKTTPPCNEPVTWYVMSQPKTISSNQVSRLLELSGGPNNRPLQPRGERVIISAG